MKKDKTYSLISNVCYMIKFAWNMEEKKVIILCLLSFLFNTILNLLQLTVLPVLLMIIENHQQLYDFLMVMLIFVGSMVLSSFIVSYIEANTLFGRISVRTALLAKLNNKAAKTSYPNLDNKKFSDLLAKASKVCRSNAEATEKIWETLTNLLTKFFTFIGCLFILIQMQWTLLLMVFITTTLSYGLTHYLQKYRYKHLQEEAQLEKQMNYVLHKAEDFKAAKDIRIFYLQSWLDDLFVSARNCYQDFQNKVQAILLFGDIFDLLMTFVRNGIIYIYLLYRFMNGNLGIAEFLLMFNTVSQFSEEIRGIFFELTTLYQESLELSVFRSCLDYPEIFKFEDGKSIDKKSDSMYEIKLENVSFRYPEATKDILTNINLTIHPGENLAIVGLNGAGKTTLVKLICGFLDPTQGRVLLNGEDIRHLNRNHYYDLFSAVFQDFSILAGSIALNITQGSQTNRDIKACLDQAGLTSFVESLPNKMETNLVRNVYDEAIDLSGGQLQRLMLSRALYKDAPIVVLDEPTAALDPISESQLYQQYHEMTKGKSSIYISHRLASTRFCDRIILIHESIIYEEGTHEQLLKLNGKYTYLYEMQSQYYQEEGDPDER